MIKILDMVPSWVWAAAVAILLALSAQLKFTGDAYANKYYKEQSAHKQTKLDNAASENRSLLNMSERLILLGNALSDANRSGVSNNEKIKNAINRRKLIDASSSVRDSQATAASDRAKQFESAGYDRAGAYATGVERVYRSCRKEYIDLGLGTGGAAEAANAAYTQKAIADSLTNTLRDIVGPTKPTPPVSPIPPNQ